MTNKYFRVLLGVAATMLLASTASANLLVNAGFEDDPFAGAEVGGAGIGWTPFGGVFRIQGQPPIGPAGAHGGTVALKVFGVAGVHQTFAASAGQTWDGGAWVLNDSADAMGGGQVAAVNIEWLDAGGNTIDFISNGSFNCNAGDCSAAPLDIWTLQTISGVAPAGTASARLTLITGDFLPGGAGGAPRYDDAFFAQRVVPIPGALLLFGPALLGLMGFRRKNAA